jgi:ABC-type uncharacterized transport system substrate-binding protein
VKYCRAYITWLLSLLMCAMAQAQPTDAAYTGFSILHIANSHVSATDATSQLEGFKEGLGSSIATQYKTVLIDITADSSLSEREQAASLIQQQMKSWKPDLVFVSDDESILLVAQYFNNQATPFVLSSRICSIQSDGLKKSANFTGVLGKEHILETVHLMQALKPSIYRIQIISDETEYVPKIVERIERVAQMHPDFEVVGFSHTANYAEFQQLVEKNTNNADAYLILGNLNFKDAKNNRIAYPEVQHWMAEHSTIPDMSFWEDRMSHGTVAGVTASSKAQGSVAGNLARQILVEHRTPSSLPFVSATKSNLTINLRRARKLGITPSASLLLSARVFNDYAWDR